MTPKKRSENRKATFQKGTSKIVFFMISTFGCNNGLILAGSRLFYAMSSDGLFFKPAKKLNQFNVPSVAMWIQGIWASILCLSGNL